MQTSILGRNRKYKIFMSLYKLKAMDCGKPDCRTNEAYEKVAGYELILTMIMDPFVGVQEQVWDELFASLIKLKADYDKVSRFDLSLGYDYTEILGNTLAAIVGVKAGILKKGVPAFTVPQPDEAMADAVSIPI
ncbi:hypothetical protein SSX86_007577 [Deinandra increscens subsp. villosa]|uniref:Uncharacterized protein n=1 Tax=Deinandra increscens subsp. villosa TaxID=3103831 RepID=A0AAP0DLK2_9ASTR